MVTFKLNPGAEGGRGRREREGERRMEESELRKIRAWLGIGIKLGAKT